MAENTNSKIAEASENEAEKDIFAKRQSADLTPENAKFFRSKGDLISLELKGDAGKTECFE